MKNTRYIKDIWLDLPEEEVQGIIRRFLNQGQFEIRSNFGGMEYYESGISICHRFFQYRYKGGCLHIEAWLGQGPKNVEVGLTGWRGIMETSTYLSYVHQLLEELLALLPKGNPVCMALREEMRREKRHSKAGVVFMVVMLCVFAAMMIVAKSTGYR